MTSPTYDKSGAGCTLEFWYWMYGTGAGKLVVQIEEDVKEPVVSVI